MKIYVASSWRNASQPEVVRVLKAEGHEVYDFRHPSEVDKGFAWSDIDPEWIGWNGHQFRDALEHPIALKGFKLDFDAMKAADACVLVLPCGRSAHIEAGYFVGARKKLIILLLGKNEPELMYSMADQVCVEVSEVVDFLSTNT